MPDHSPRPTSPRRVRAQAALATLGLALTLAGCSHVDRTVPTGSISPDYHLRHPVVLADMPSLLDIFPVGEEGRLDRRSLRQIEVFAAEYRQSAQGPILIRAPDFPGNPATAARTVEAVRQALFRFGVRGPVEVMHYPVADPRLAAPLHLSYPKLQARVASRCGDWPDDLASGGGNLDGWQNRSYYNLGCASAKTLSAQVDDPRDLVAPRAEDPTDVQLRTRAIGLLRGTDGVNSGKDPGTAWSGAEPTPLVSLGN